MNFGILGGDERQIYLAEALKHDKKSVFICGFEKCEKQLTVESLPFNALASKCDILILPLPVTRDGKKLNMPLSKDEILLGEGFARRMKERWVFGGMMQRLKSTSDLWENIRCADYYECEALTIGNAMLTAEAALALAIERTDISLNGATCLITGFGRIGKYLCSMLTAMHATVSCAARKASDKAGIQAIGCKAIAYTDIRQSYDIIFNTVPACVLKREQLKYQGKDTVLIELASMPGGVDRLAANEFEITVIDAPSLPGRVSPKTSGEYIKEAIYNMMGE